MRREQCVGDPCQSAPSHRVQHHYQNGQRQELEYCRECAAETFSRRDSAVAINPSTTTDGGLSPQHHNGAPARRQAEYDFHSLGSALGDLSKTEQGLLIAVLVLVVLASMGSAAATAHQADADDAEDADADDAEDDDDTPDPTDFDERGAWMSACLGCEEHAGEMSKCSELWRERSEKDG